MALPTCHRCGDTLDYVEITAFGDLEPQYIPTSECDCAGPRCSLCHTRIDQPTKATSAGECPNPDCTLWCRLVPLVEVA